MLCLWLAADDIVITSVVDTGDGTEVSITIFSNDVDDEAWDTDDKVDLGEYEEIDVASRCIAVFCRLWLLLFLQRRL